MTILYVDDERSAHTIFRHSLGAYESLVEVSYHFDYDSAMDYAKDHAIDCGFLDVSLLGKDGITLARDLRALHPHIEFVFITGFDEFARAAYQVGGRAYLTKPYSQEALQEALMLMERLCKPRSEGNPWGKSQDAHVFAKTFGSFDLLVDGVPLYFKYSKAKELLAYLIHQMGGSVTSAQVFYALWDRQTYTRDNSTYVRRTIRLLKEELEQHGLSELVISQRNSIRVDTQKLGCDAYQLLGGNAQAAATFDGTYLSQYPWAESGVALLNKAASAHQTQS